MAALVALGFVVMARDDLRTGQVVVRQAQITTLVAVVGLGLPAALTGRWGALISAAVGAVVITGVQAVPYLAQRRLRRAMIGRADVRLAVPFGWTLGMFGLGWALLGFAVALVAGLLTAAITRREQMPFVPFLTAGLVVGLVAAGAYQLSGS
ncbi:MAG: A24 family peptidase [Actinomycetota bacterium]